MNMSRWILANGENLQVVLFFSLLVDEVRGRDAHRPLWLLASVAHDDLDRQSRGAEHAQDRARL